VFVLIEHSVVTVVSSFTSLTVRNKDNSWPEEMIKLLKELKAKEKKKQSHTDSTATVGKHVHHRSPLPSH